MTVSAELVNTGEEFAASELVQVYVTRPEGDLTRPVSFLDCFQKSRLLAPGESQTVTLRFPITELSVYREHAHAFVLEGMGFSVVHTAMLPDEAEQISAELRACADEKKIGLIVTTGGTGLSPRDVTPEATLAVLDREIRAIPVAMWVEGLKATPRAMLSRAVAGTRGSSLILNLPGSEKAARENLSAVLGALEHAMHMLAAEGHG